MNIFTVNNIKYSPQCICRYKMPLTLCGIFLVLALWEGIRMLLNYFKLEKESLFYQAFLLFGKIGMLNDHEMFVILDH